jgi:KaiC/GvpD/RAD55 family RecA-like ATPase
MSDTAETSAAVVSMLQAALDYAEQGLRIFPVWHVDASHRCVCPAGGECPDPGKHPHVSRWQVVATDHGPSLRRWWAQWPDANIGLITGATNGFVVADFDPRHGGDQTLAQLEAANGGAFQTVTALSGGGGVHLFFAVGADSRLRNGRGIRPGLDRRGNGGYVVSAPSMHASGHRYVFAAGLGLGAPMQSVPDWLNEQEIDRGEPDVVPVVLPVGPRDHVRIDRYARRALDLEANAVRTAPKGARNDRLNEAAFCLGQLVGSRALDQGLVESMLFGAAKAAGLGIREIQKTIRSGLETGIKRPRAVPERTALARALPGADMAHDSDPPVPPGGVRATPAQDVPAYRLLADGIEHEMRSLGPRIATGFRSLDKWTGGGIPCGTLVVLLAPPNVGKSSLAAHLAHVMEAYGGCACVYFAADEAARGIYLRIGQMMGFERDDLEAEGDFGAARRAAYAARARDPSRKLAIINPYVDGAATVEAAHAALLDFAADRPRVMFVDSLQSASFDVDAGVDIVRERIDARLKQCVGIARTGTTVVLISEMPRAAYANRGSSAERDPIAGGKESGGIEFRSDLQLTLKPVQGQRGFVDLSVDKNRITPVKHVSLRLRQDWDSAAFSEVTLPGTPTKDERDAAIEVQRDARQFAKLADAESKVLDAVRTTPALHTMADVVAATSARKQDVYRAVRALELRGQLTKAGGAYAVAGSDAGA